MPYRDAINTDSEETPLLADPGEETAEDGLPKVQVAIILLSHFVESVASLFAFPFLGNVRWDSSSGTFADPCDRSLSAMCWNTLLSFR